MNDPWWLIITKVVIVFVMLLVWTIFNVWFERRVLGKMQNRKGPIMNGPLGLPQALGDGLKLMFKEDFRPARTDSIVFNLAPYLTSAAAFTMWTVIPIGGQVTIFGHTTNLQITDFPVSVLFIMAIASIGIYGIVLAGWASNGTYSLLGSMRATAQLISYEISMGLALVAVFLYAGSMSTSEVVAAQTNTMSFFGLHLSVPGWYGLILFPSFVTYIISMFGETNRLPFDLSECESELVSGHITDYSGFRYALYFLAEYINMATVSAVATTLFLGGYHAPWPLNFLFDGRFDQGWWTPIWFIVKVQCLIFLFAWARAALPRFRYDQFMSLGWKILIPINIAWIFLLTILRGYQNASRAEQTNSMASGSQTVLIVAAVVIGLAVLVLLAIALQDKKPEPTPVAVETGEFDAFAGGYPVPPMPGEEVTALIGVAEVPTEPVPPRRVADGEGGDL